MLEVTTTSDEGFASESTIREFTVDIDPAGEAAPTTLESLLAAYAACFVPALRVGAEQRGVGDLGRVEIAVTGELNDDDKLEATTFDISVEADIDDDEADRAVARGLELCKVHDALKDSVRAEITVEGGAF